MPRTGVDQNLNLSNLDDTIISYEDVEQRQKDSAERMKKMCVQMVKDFGEQPVTMKALDEVIRFERAMKVIKRTESYKNADKLEKGQSSRQSSRSKRSKRRTAGREAKCLLPALLLFCYHLCVILSAMKQINAQGGRDYG